MQKAHGALNAHVFLLLRCPFFAASPPAPVVFPNNGSNTAVFKPCFEQVENACSSDMSEAFSFCAVINQPGDNGETASHGMLHVIEVGTGERAAR